VVFLSLKIEKEKASMSRRYVQPPRNKPDTEPRTPSDAPLEPLLIRLLEPIGLLPAGSFVYELPRFESEILIMRRKAVVQGKLGTIPDLVLSEDELAEVAELDGIVIPIDGSVEIIVETPR
jgi:hypothetical protein